MVSTIAWFIGLFLAVSGGLKLLIRLPLIIGLLGANKLGTAKDGQIDENKDNIHAMKEGLPAAALMIVVGIILIFASDYIPK